MTLVDTSVLVDHLDVDDAVLAVTIAEARVGTLQVRHGPSRAGHPMPARAAADGPDKPCHDGALAAIMRSEEPGSAMWTFTCSRPFG